MTDHKPECIYEPQHFDPEQNIVWDGKPCICEQLRACEQRVREEECHKPRTIQISDMNYTHNMGYAAALDAAREAVEVAVTDALEALNPLDPQTVNRALAAIDALRGERK